MNINAPVLRREFQECVRNLVGVKCWGVVAGSGTGSVISLQLGKKIRRKVEFTNPYLSREQRRFDPEVEIFVESAWRLDSPSQVVCGCWDDNRAEGPMKRGLGELVGKVISKAHVDKPGLDLTLAFGEDHKLRVFCDQVNELDARDNYSIHLQQAVLVVGTRSRLRKEATSIR
jgi:hypothetical protein